MSRMSMLPYRHGPCPTQGTAEPLSLAGLVREAEAPHARLAVVEVAEAGRAPTAARCHSIDLVGDVGHEEGGIDRTAEHVVPIDVEVEDIALRHHAEDQGDRGVAAGIVEVLVGMGE